MNSSMAASDLGSMMGTSIADGDDIGGDGLDGEGIDLDVTLKDGLGDGEEDGMDPEGDKDDMEGDKEEAEE